MHITRGRTLIALMLGMAALLLGSGAALAAGPPQRVVAVMATPEEDGQVLVSAQFASAQGQAFSGLEVRFFLLAEFLVNRAGVMGQSRVFLGSATTDATGKAQVRYTPSWEGTQRVVARLPGGEGSTTTETTIAFDVTGIRSIYEPEPPALGPIREWTPVAVGTVVVLVWATMALVLVRTIYGIIAAGRRRDLAAQRYPIRAGVGASRPHRQFPQRWRERR